MLKLRINPIVAVDLKNIRDYIAEDNEKYAEITIREIYDKFEYKSKWNGRNYIKIDRFYASSQLCFSCGYKNINVKNLKVRDWICTSCNTKYDRDSNVAKNILAEGLRKVV